VFAAVFDRAMIHIIDLAQEMKHPLGRLLEQVLSEDRVFAVTAGDREAADETRSEAGSQLSAGTSASKSAGATAAFDAKVLSICMEWYSVGKCSARDCPHSHEQAFKSRGSVRDQHWGGGGAGSRRGGGGGGGGSSNHQGGGHYGGGGGHWGDAWDGGGSWNAKGGKGGGKAGGKGGGKGGKGKGKATFTWYQGKDGQWAKWYP
jgi:hypothetical protein